jgi:hypothetical protein
MEIEIATTELFVWGKQLSPDLDMGYVELSLGIS